ncbi:hypothetical protein CDL15_Pgr027061 [Punica granatum]|uniref:DNA-directed RNA polymerase n=1 Tax=Punica granatum TaxID=22663 RepID=A0A218XIX3_PUNGR|nr:hypothetical protein CDL15_Pgr027061 [Punica granatum]PKI46130.1 hypothetical protein CRG98_033463 [Punica granatum]
MHGKKGVLGLLKSQEQALEKGIACGGPVKYATPFSAPSIDDIADQLHRVGYTKWGNERVYDGRTGKAAESLILVGPTFYQRLVHMAEDKLKFRSTDPIHPLTRQPVFDRKRFGGISFGEMERDCLIAHGASANLHERFHSQRSVPDAHLPEVQEHREGDPEGSFCSYRSEDQVTVL